MTPTATSAQPVAGAPDGLEVDRLGGIAFDLFAQTSNVDGECACVDGGCIPPDAGHQLVSREDVVRVRGEEPEQVELLRCEAQLAAGPRRLSVRDIELDLPELNLGGDTPERR